MGWLQENGVVLGTFAATATMLVGLWWRVLRSIQTDIGKLGGAVEELRRETEKLRRETKELGRDTETVCVEGRQANKSICARIARVRKGLSTEITEMRDGLHAEITEMHDGLSADITEMHKGLSAEIAGVREGLGEVRGELKGVTRSIDTLREDFRAHVFGYGGR